MHSHCCRRSDDQTSRIGSQIYGSGDQMLALVVRTAASAIGLPVATVSIGSWPTHQIDDLVARWGEGEPLRVFVKCFTKFWKVNHFTSLITFYIQTNIWKWKTLSRKYFTSKQIVLKKSIFLSIDIFWNFALFISLRSTKH